MKVFVTGGTGFVGRNIVHKLSDERHQVRCLVRPSSRRDFSDIDGVEYQEGDITERDSLNGAVDGCDGVIHIVGIIKEIKGAKFEKVHSSGTKNVVDEAKLTGVSKFVHMSALGARPDAVSRYHKTKWEGEEAVKESGIPYVILRPSIICGRDDEFVNLFANMMRFPGVITRTLPVIGSGESKMQPISVEDVAFCFVKALSDENITNKEYDLGGPEQLTFNQIMDTIMHVTKRRRFKAHIPSILMYPVASILEKIHPNPPFNRDQLKMLKEDNVGDITAMREDFGIEPARFEDVIRTYL